LKQYPKGLFPAGYNRLRMVVINALV